MSYQSSPYGILDAAVNKSPEGGIYAIDLISDETEIV